MRVMVFFCLGGAAQSLAGGGINNNQSIIMPIIGI